jgi:hypothetical protein
MALSAGHLRKILPHELFCVASFEKFATLLEYFIEISDICGW